MQLFNLPDRKSEYGMTFISWMMIKQVLKKASKRRHIHAFFFQPSLIMQKKPAHGDCRGHPFMTPPLFNR